MDEVEVRRIIEEYLSGRGGEDSFELALVYLKSAPQDRANLDDLFRDLDLPGGFSHEETHELMPYYLEPFSREQLTYLERRRFVAHLTRCPDCAEDYLALRGFEGEVSVFRQAAPREVHTPTIPKPWPLLEPIIQTLNQARNLVRYSIAFSPAIRETNPNAPLTEYSELFDDSLDENAFNGLTAAVIAWRNTLTTCDLQIELTDPLGQNRQASQTILVTYENQPFTLTTDSNGEAVLPGLEIEKLASLKIQIEIKTV